MVTCQASGLDAWLAEEAVIAVEAQEAHDYPQNRAGAGIGIGLSTGAAHSCGGGGMSSKPQIIASSSWSPSDSMLPDRRATNDAARISASVGASSLARATQVAMAVRRLATVIISLPWS